MSRSGGVGKQVELKRLGAGKRFRGGGCLDEARVMMNSHSRRSCSPVFHHLSLDGSSGVFEPVDDVVDVKLFPSTSTLQGIELPNVVFNLKKASG